jgi:hypothetical protein
VGGGKGEGVERSGEDVVLEELEEGEKREKRERCRRFGVGVGFLVWVRMGGVDGFGVGGVD